MPYNDRKQRQYDRAREKKVQAQLAKYKAEKGCIDCGEKDPVVLDFDHVRGEKIFSMSRGAYKASQERIEAEMEKCDVRCANCHRKRHAKEGHAWEREIERLQIVLPGMKS